MCFENANNLGLIISLVLQWIKVTAKPDSDIVHCFVYCIHRGLIFVIISVKFYTFDLLQTPFLLWWS